MLHARQREAQGELTRIEDFEDRLLVPRKGEGKGTDGRVESIGEINENAG